MPTVKELIRDGRLVDARKELIELVKNAPADTVQRTLLFQVLVYLGEFAKAEFHLKILAGQNKNRLPMFDTCFELLNAEKERLTVKSGNTPPDFLPEAPPCRGEYGELLKMLAAGNGEETAELREKLTRELAPVGGTINGAPFQEFQDTDTALTWFLETFVHERYLLVPLAAIRELTIAPPANFLDLCWIPAQITLWKDGLSLNCYLPVLYARSFEADDELIRLGRKTSWNALGGSALQGAGQHVFESAGKDYGLLEIREMTFTYQKTEAGKQSETETPGGRKSDG